MEHIIKRVKDEKSELDGKIIKLQIFLNGDESKEITAEHFRLLGYQFQAMKLYSNILNDRLNLLENNV